MNTEDNEYLEQLALKDQALRTMEAIINSDKNIKLMKASMIKNGMTDNAATLSLMEMMELNVK